MCPSLGGCGGGGGGSEGTCCVCDQEDGCACKNGTKDFKCMDGYWKVEGKEGSDYSSGAGGSEWHRPRECPDGWTCMGGWGGGKQ